MRRCVVHIGMAKTGSTSIQTFLCDGLTDRRFRYLGFGQTNGSNALCTLFADHPEQFWCYRSGQLKARRLTHFRAACDQRLRRDLQAARSAGACPILSGEECWRFSREELIRVRERLREEGYAAQIVVYLRPYAQWLESGFQQWVQWEGACDFSALTAVSGRGGIGRFNYVGRLQVLADVFGHAQLLARPFTRAALGASGVVSDFCATVGIDGAGHREPRANPSLALDAIRVLYALNTHSRRQRPWSLPATGALVRHLAAMPGVPLRFCPSLLAPIAGELEHQHRQLRERFGVDLGEPLAPLAAGEGVACEADLLRCSPAALAWLAASLGEERIAAEPVSSEAVAAWVERRRRRLLRRHGPALVRERLGQAWHQQRRRWRWVRRRP